MADICISYAREDIGLVRRVFDELAAVFDVWWDQTPFSGDYRQQIERQLRESRCCIPLWSRHSRTSAHVIDEVRFAQDAGLILLPVRLDDAPPPMGFGGLQTIDLAPWARGEDEQGLAGLITTLGHLLRRGVQRTHALAIGNGLPAPHFVFSVSSHETQIAPDSAVEALAIWKPQSLLVSAYDVAREGAGEKFGAEVDRCKDNGVTIFLDSGNYESYRKSDATWQRSEYRAVLEQVPHDAAFSFDRPDPYRDLPSAIAATVELAAADAEHTRAPIIPIVHRPTDTSGRHRPDWLIELIRETARALRPPLIAVPERELGQGVVERARSVFDIRQALDSLGYYQPMHILGTGNAMTFAILAAAGADCCDGLEWCRTVADHQSGNLFHFHHYDLFKWQSRLSSSEVVRVAVENEQLPYAGKVAFHNLDFFDTWTSDVREATWSDTIDRFLIEKLPGGNTTLKQLGASIPEVFA